MLSTPHAHPAPLTSEGAKLWARRPGCSYTLTPTRVRHSEPNPNSIAGQRRGLPPPFSPEKNWMAWEIVTFPTRLLQTTSCTLGVFLGYQLLRPRNSVSTIRRCCPENSLPREAPEQSPFTLCTAWSIGSRLRSGRTESCCVR